MVEYECEFPAQREEQIFAVLLWCRYHVACEEYDRTVCSLIRDGVAIPVFPWERSLCSVNALSERRKMFDDSEQHGIDRETMNTANGLALSLGHEQQKELLSNSAAWILRLRRHA